MLHVELLSRAAAVNCLLAARLSWRAVLLLEAYEYAQHPLRSWSGPLLCCWQFLACVFLTQVAAVPGFNAVLPELTSWSNQHSWLAVVLVHAGDVPA